MAEFHYAFIKNNRVEDICVFASQNEELADLVATEKGFDDAVWVGENVPVKWSTYDGSTFTPPTLDYLYEIGISPENQAMYDARVAAQQAELEALGE